MTTDDNWVSWANKAITLVRHHICSDVVAPEIFFQCTLQNLYNFQLYINFEMVWGWITWNGVGTLTVVSGKID